MKAAGPLPKAGEKKKLNKKQKKIMQIKYRNVTFKQSLGERGGGSGGVIKVDAFITADPIPHVKYIQLIMTFIRF